MVAKSEAVQVPEPREPDVTGKEFPLLAKRDEYILAVAGQACANCVQLRLPLARELALAPQKSIALAALEVAEAVTCTHIEDTSDITANVEALIAKPHETTVELP